MVSFFVCVIKSRNTGYTYGKIRSQKKINLRKKEDTMSVIKVTKQNFESVKASDKRVLLDFYADWCGPCRMVSPLVDQIADEHPEYVVGKINVDESPELASRFGVVSIPTLVVLDGGEIKTVATGARPKPAILALLAD